MDFLDMKTVVFSYTFSSAICTVVILLLWIQNRRRFAGLGFWLANFVMQWIAIILVILRGTVPDIVSMVISNVLIIGGTLLLYIGIERFIGKRSSQIHNAILLVIFALVHTYFTAVHPSLIARNLNFSIGSLVIGLQGAWLMLYRADAEMRPITRRVGIVVVALCLVGLIRIFVDLAMPPADDFFHSNIFETLLILSYQMLYIVLTFTLFLMVNRCLFADLERGLVARQQAEEALRQSEKKFFTAFQASPDAILITHFPDGQIIEVNESFVYLSGYSREEVLTSSTIELGVWAHPQDREECLAALQENHRVRDREYDFRTRSGQILNTLYSGEVIRLGNDLYVLSVIRDITERKQAEARLRASELRYDQLVRRIPVGVYTFRTCADGSTYSFEYTSPQFNYLLGLDAEAALRDANLAFAAAQPEDRAVLVRANRQAITTLTPLRWEGRFTVRGETRWLRIEADPTPLPGGDSLWAGVVSDVTARRQVEQELLAREHELRVITDNIPVYISYVDADLRYRFVNKKYVEAFGLNAGAIIGRHVREVLGEAYYDRAAPQIAAALTGQEISFESPIHLPQQGLRWLSVNYVPEITARGSVNGLYILVQDITERKQTEAVVQLRLRLFEFAAGHSLEELMQKALDGIGEITGSPIGFYHFVEEDQKTLSLQAWSTRTLQEFCRAAGQGRHYSLDQAGVWVDCVYQRRPVIHNDYAALPHRRGMPNGHAEIIRELVVPTLREGRIVSILGVGNKSSDYDQNDVELVAYVADIIWTIVERKRAETQLQAYQHQLEAQNLELRKLTLAIEQSGSAIVITDAHGTIQYVNPRFEETSGYTLQEVLGQNPRLLKSGEQNAEYYRVLWQTITSGQVWHGELRNRRKDGSLYWESATIAPVQDTAGQIMAYIAIKEDITARKQAQADLQRYADELAARNEELDAFAHTVAHDLKNPIGLIVGYAELLLSEDETAIAQEQQVLQIIARTGHKLNAIIEELMLLSGLRKETVTPVPLDMPAIVLEAQQRLHDQIQKSGASITHMEAPWPVVWGYAPWIEEVWANYLSNAIKYGGQPPQIQVGATVQPDGQARFWVRDNGAGLGTEAQANLFTPFTRLAQAHIKGHGLGLSIVRRIVERLGGTVGVESAPRQGSVFFFTLPLAASSPTPPVSRPAPGAAAPPD